MKKTRNLGILTASKLVEIGAFVGVTSGQQLIERFCAAIEAGVQPDTDDLKKLAAALHPLRYNPGEATKDASDNEHRDALAKFSNLLGLNKKQGRQEESAGRCERMALPVVLYKIKLDELISAGKTQREAKTIARNFSAEYAAIGDRAMRNRIRDYDEFSDAMIRSFGADFWRKKLEEKSGK